MNSHQQYSRVEADDILEAKRLFDLGYRSVSNKYRHIARPDEEGLKELGKLRGQKTEGSFGVIGCWQDAEYARRCSSDVIEGVDEWVMVMLRRMAKIELGCATCIVTCIDNKGYESYFDTGIEYIKIGHQYEHVWVIDKFGQMRRCLDARFV